MVTFSPRHEAFLVNAFAGLPGQVRARLYRYVTRELSQVRPLLDEDVRRVTRQVLSTYAPERASA
jgi:hypothetical protein